LVRTITVLKSHLLSQSPITAIVGQRVYGGRNFQPKSWQPAQAAIVFNGRGGFPDYASTFLGESFAFKCYHPDEVQAMAFYEALVTGLHDKHGPDIRHAQLEVTGVATDEQEPLNYHFVLCFFRVTFNFRLGG